ncbi:MAG: putative bifunctional diguanylate cyclase/phosphodiesterase [Lautropia sp.]
MNDAAPPPADKALHATLKRQLRRLGLTPDAPPSDPATWRALIASMNRAYEEADQLVYLVTRAERKSTDELERSQAALAEAQRMAGLGSWSYVPGDSRLLVSTELGRLIGVAGHGGKIELSAMLARIDESHRLIFSRALQRAGEGAIDETSELFLEDEEGGGRWCQYRMRSRLRADGSVERVDGTLLDITERRRAEENVKALAFLDPLTGLSNRAKFQEYLDAAVKHCDEANDPFAVLFIDLDGFKGVNDSLGHNAGDELLRQVATRLREGVRTADRVARFGGDEFLILLNGARNADEAERVARKLLDSLARPMTIENQPVSISGSIGIATHTDRTGINGDLIRRADAAMYAAKEAGRNACRVYSREFDGRPTNTRLLAHDLRQSIAQDQLQVVYQPIVDGADGSIVGVEALSRWKHPVSGPIGPDVFIPLAEKFGLIDELSASMMNKACAQLRRMIDVGGPALFLSMNVSPHQLAGNALVRDLAAAVATAGISPANIRLEVTEGAIMSDPVRAATVLGDLTAMGYRISLDDFGTGQSSLAYLQQLPVHCIKIDRSFVSGLEKRVEAGPILRAIVGMASGLNCEVLSEGVELELQRNRLLALGCRLMQGYHFARPQSGDDVLELLAPRADAIDPAAAADAVGIAAGGGATA